MVLSTIFRIKRKGILSEMYTAKCTGHLKSVDSILRSKARLAALDP